MLAECRREGACEVGAFVGSLVGAVVGLLLGASVTAVGASVQCTSIVSLLSCSRPHSASLIGPLSAGMLQPPGA